MINIIKAPNKYILDDRPTLFLGGVIDNGTAEDWQKTITESLKDYEITLLNPRRENWNPTWDATVDNPQFVEQVRWELVAQEQATHIVYVFGSDETQAKLAKAPVTMLELGLHAKSDKKVWVCCPKGFYRKGNIDMTCDHYSIPYVESLDQLIKRLQIDLHAWQT